MNQGRVPSGQSVWEFPVCLPRMPLLRAKVRGVPATDDLESVECIHFGFQGTGAHSGSVPERPFCGMNDLLVCSLQRRLRIPAGFHGETADLGAIPPVHYVKGVWCNRVNRIGPDEYAASRIVNRILPTRLVPVAVVPSIAIA